MAKQESITAVHPTMGTREFTPESWKLLGSDKGGWEVKAEKPKELK